MFGDLGLSELMFTLGAAVVGFGAVKFMLMARSDERKERDAAPAAEDREP